MVCSNEKSHPQRWLTIFDFVAPALAGENFYLCSILGAIQAHVAQPPSAVVLSLKRIVWFERNGWSLNETAKSQWPKAAFSHTTATYPNDGVQSRSAAFPTLQVAGGRGNL